MAVLSLGIVTDASTTVPVRVTTTRGIGHLSAQSVQFQALGTNTGVVYICNTLTPNLTTGVGVLVEIPAPSASTPTGSRPAWQVGVPTGAAALDANEFWVLPSVTNEGVRVTVARP